jgi:type IV pilus assembly protein PilW
MDKLTFMKNSVDPGHDQRGFTLVELMVSLVVAFLVIAAVVASYKMQQQTETAQQQVTETQQNLRAAMETMMRTFRMAGYDPTGEGKYLINNATATTFAFDGDLCEDGGDPADCAPTAEEVYNFSLDPVNGTVSRTPGGTAIAENIERLEFRYRMANGTYFIAPPPSQFKNIRAVQISLVVRSSEPDYKFTDTKVLKSRGGTDWPPPAQFVNHRRRILYSTIELRNMGL